MIFNVLVLYLGLTLFLFSLGGREEFSDDRNEGECALQFMTIPTSKLYRYTYTYIYTYIYIYIYTHTHTYIYIYIEREREKDIL